MKSFLSSSGVIAILALAGVAGAQVRGNGWAGYGGNAQHTGISPFRSQPLNRILWSAPMDTAPPYSGNSLYIHYGEPAVTLGGTVIFPERMGSRGFVVQARDCNNGRLIWQAYSHLQFPSYSWIPSFGLTLLPPNAALATQKTGTTPSPFLIRPHLSPSVAYPDLGGRVTVRTSVDFSKGTLLTHAFYGDAAFALNPSAFEKNVQICTPLTAGPDGSIYFGFYVSGPTPNNLKSGIAVLRPNGTGAWLAASAAAGDPSVDRVQMNCAPALSPDGTKLYVGVATGYWANGYLCCINPRTMQPIAHTALIDPLTKQNAGVLSDSTGCPTIAPDGSVFYGVFESSYGQNHARGWMLHFSGDLSTSYTPGAFGWDLTSSIVPASAVSFYHGTSSFLLMCKYNNYAETGGNGVNKIAILDPGATETDPITGVTVMNEVKVMPGPTPDAYYRANGFPDAVREWCINSAAIDPFGQAIIVNCEDGVLYRWDLVTGNLTQSIRLTPGIGEAYTPTVICPNGVCLAINNATLYAVGQ